MDKIKSMAISASFIILLVGFIPVLDERVVSDAGRNTTAYNITDPLASSIVELTPVVVLALAVAFGMGVLQVLN